MSSRKKILFVVAHLANSSPVIQLFGIVNHIDRKHYKPIIVSVFKEREESIQRRFAEIGINVINLNLERWQFVKQHISLKKLIRKLKPDLIHSCMIIVDGICAYENFKIPWIITLHCYIYEDILSRYGKLVSWFLCKREERAIKKADIAVTCSYTLKKKYECVIRRKFIAIQNGIETEIWSSDIGLSKQELREKLMLPKNAFIFLSTNLLEEVKDPILLLQTFKRLALKNSCLIMLGNGKMEIECKNYASSNIFFKGKVCNVKEYLYASDVVVSASRSEGLPYAVLEAACTGIPMILSDIPQHIEVVGSSAKLFVTGDETSLARAMKEIYEESQGKVQYDLKELTASVMSKKYQEIYKYIWEKRK